MSDKNLDIPSWPQVLRTADRAKERNITRALICFAVVTMLASLCGGWLVAEQQKAEASTHTTRGR